MTSEIYQKRFLNKDDYRKNVWLILVKLLFQRYIDHDAHVLDLGCGWGEFINQINASHKYAMDINPDSPNFLDSDIKHIQHDCSKPWPLPEDSLDVIFTSNFLEHLNNKEEVSDALKQAYGALKKDGLIICMGPNIRFTSDVYWDFWDHHVAISDRSLSELLQLIGFQNEKVISKFLPYTMSGDDPPPPLWMLKLYLKIPMIWKIFGKQFLIMARK